MCLDTIFLSGRKLYKEGLYFLSSSIKIQITVVFNLHVAKEKELAKIKDFKGLLRLLQTPTLPSVRMNRGPRIGKKKEQNV